MRVRIEDFILHGLFGDVRMWMPWSELHAALPGLPRYEANGREHLAYATEGAVEITLQNDKVWSIKLTLDEDPPPLPSGIELAGPTRISESALKRLLDRRRVPWIRYAPLSDVWGDYYWTTRGVHLTCSQRQLNAILYDGGQLRLDRSNE